MTRGRRRHAEDLGKFARVLYHPPVHPLADPRLEPVVAAIRARGGDFVRAPGARPTVTLGTGNAVFMGGISAVDPGGGPRVVRATRSI